MTHEGSEPSLPLSHRMPSAEERYRAFIENSTEGIWRVELEQPVPIDLPEEEQVDAFYRFAHLAECNQAFARMYGFARADALFGARLGDLLIRDDPANEEYLRAFVRAGYRLEDVESVERDREGRIRRFSNTLRGVVENGHLVRAWGTQRDITAQREAEARLRESLSLLEAVANTTTDSVFVKDVDGRYVLANPVVSRLYGRPAEEIVGRLDVDFVPEDEARRLRENDEMIMTSGSSRIYHEEVTVFAEPKAAASLRVLHVTKSPWRDPDSGGIRGVVGIGRDVTEQVNALQALAQREQDYAALVDNAPDVLARFDRGFHFLYVNEQGARNTGIAREAFLGRTFRELASQGMGLPEANIRQWEQAITRVFATGEPQHIEYQFPTPQGIAYFECDLAPEFNGGGMEEIGNPPVKTVVTVTRNITDRRLLEAEREAQQVKQRNFVREMLLFMTEGKLHLCDSPEELPVRRSPVPAPGVAPIPLSRPTLRTLRQLTELAARGAGLPEMRWQDLETAAGEASLNAVVHAGGGYGSVCVDREQGVVQVWIVDYGAGIAPERLHRATLERGYTTAGTLGHGFYLMLRTCDRIWLLTGAGGTTVVLEQERTPPEPAWFQDFA